MNTKRKPDDPDYWKEVAFHLMTANGTTDSTSKRCYFCGNSPVGFDPYGHEPDCPVVLMHNDPMYPEL